MRTIHLQIFLTGIAISYLCLAFMAFKTDRWLDVAFSLALAAFFGVMTRYVEVPRKSGS
jgi:hypothetical protein